MLCLYCGSEGWDLLMACTYTLQKQDVCVCRLPRKVRRHVPRQERFADLLPGWACASVWHTENLAASQRQFSFFASANSCHFIPNTLLLLYVYSVLREAALSLHDFQPCPSQSNPPGPWHARHTHLCPSWQPAGHTQLLPPPGAVKQRRRSEIAAVWKGVWPFPTDACPSLMTLTGLSCVLVPARGRWRFLPRSGRVRDGPGPKPRLVGAALPISAGRAGAPPTGKSTRLWGWWWWFCLHGRVLAATRGLRADGWCGMEVGGAAARGWTGCLEDALSRSRRLGGDGREARAPLSGPRWSCMRQPLGKALQGLLVPGWESGEPWAHLGGPRCGRAAPGISRPLLAFQLRWGSI